MKGGFVGRFQGRRAVVVLDGDALVIQRSGMLEKMLGPVTRIALSEVTEVHVSPASLLGTGYVQLSIAHTRPHFDPHIAAADPLTVPFRRHQQAEMLALVEALRRRIGGAAVGQLPAGVPGPVGRGRTATPATEEAAVQIGTQVARSGADFVGFDVETANGSRASICALGLAVVEDGRLTERISWLCRPPAEVDRFDFGNTALHGIAAADVAGSPHLRDRLADMFDLIGDRPVVAHNADFDISAIRQAAVLEGISGPRLSYGCTLALSRTELPGLPDYRLPTVSDALGVTMTRHHDASSDAAAAAEIALALMHRRATASFGELLDMAGSALQTITITADDIRPGSEPESAIPAWVALKDTEFPRPNIHADRTHPLFGRTVVVTGIVPGRGRDAAFGELAERGAVLGKSVTKATTVVVAGDWQDSTGRPVVTGKLAEARRRRADGQSLVIVPGEEFDRLLAGDPALGLPELIDPYALADDSTVPAAERTDPAAVVHGTHFTAWRETIKQLKRAGRLEEQRELLTACVAASERVRGPQGTAPDLWFTEQAAMT